MTYLEFKDAVEKCNWSPFAPVFLEYWEPDDVGGEVCKRVPVVNIRFENGEVIVFGPTPVFKEKSS